MSSPEPILYPCPQCGQARGEMENVCKNCGWDPNPAVATVTPKKLNSEPYSKLAALIIGFFTLLPIAYFFFFIAFVFLSFGSAGGPAMGSFEIVFVLHIAVMVLAWCLIGFYIYYLFNTDYVEQDKKALWAVVLLWETRWQCRYSGISTFGNQRTIRSDPAELARFGS